VAISKKALAEVEKVIGDMDLQELIALKAGIDERITELQDAARDEFVRSMRERAEQLNLNLADLAPALGIRVSGGAGGGRGRRASSNGTSEGPPVKFRNPKNHSETWSGRGRRAGWLTREMASRGLSEKDPVPNEFLVSTDR
jgi:DNA-binding protein H-NS